MLRFLKVHLGLISEDFNNGIRAAQKEAKEFEKTIKPSKELLREMGTAATAAGLAIVGSMTAMAKSSANYGEELKKASEQTGESVQQLARMRFAAEQNEATFADLSAGMKILARNLDDANTGAKAQQKTFRDLGIAVTDSAGKLRPLSAVMLDVADRFARMEDGAQKAALAQELFGRNGQALIPMLNQGRDGLQQMGDQAERLGLVISTKAAAEADKFNDTLAEMKAATLGLSNSIGQAILPSLTQLAIKARDGIVVFKDFTREHENLTKAIYAAGAALTGAGGLMLGLSGLLAILPRIRVAIQALSAPLVVAAGAFTAVAGVAFAFRKELGTGLLMVLEQIGPPFAKFLELMGKAADAVGSGRLAMQLFGIANSVRDFSFSVTDNLNALAEMQMIIPPTAKQLEALQGATVKAAGGFQRASTEATETRNKLADMRAELERDRVAFENMAKLEFWKSTQDGLEEIEQQLRKNNQLVIDMARSQLALQKELSGSMVRLNAGVQEDLEERLRQTNRSTIEGIKKEAEERKRAAEENKRALERATEDVKRSAGAVFDAMFLKGESVFSSLRNALKGGALSLGRAIFEDIAGALLGPVKKAFDDFIGGIVESISKKVGGAFVNALGGSASFDWQGPVQQAAGATGGAGSAIGSAASGIASGGVIGAAVSAVGSIGVIFQLKRLEGTMNAVEYNTRAAEIHQGVMINSFFHPWTTFFDWTMRHAETHTNQLDAIFNALQQPLAAGPPGAPMSASSSTTNNYYSTVNVTGTAGEDPATFAQRVALAVSSIIHTGRDGHRADWSLALSQTKGNVSTMPSYG